METREVLEPLADTATRLRIAVVAVTHLNKGGGGGSQGALNRFAGSIAFVAAERAAFAVIEDPEDDERRFLLQAKNNLGKKCKGLAFRLEQRLVGDDVMSSNVMFEGDHVSESIDEALSASENRGTKKGQLGGGKEDLIEFLRDILSDGPVDVLEVERQARAAALLEDNKRLSKSKSFRDARTELGIKSTRDGFGPGSRYVLELPDAPWAPMERLEARNDRPQNPSEGPESPLALPVRMRRPVLYRRHRHVRGRADRRGINQRDEGRYGCRIQRSGCGNRRILGPSAWLSGRDDPACLGTSGRFGGPTSNAA